MIFNRENKSLIDYLIIFIFSIIIYQFTYGVATLDPSNINWLMSAYHDWGQHYLGWAYFREEPWTFPIGNIQNYNYPAGTNIGLTDSIPLLGIFFKLFSILLGEEFQYFGFWLLLCFFLNGYYSYKIFKLYYDESKIVLLISTFFIIVNPVLLYRGMHPALCGQWLILASLYNYLKNSNINNVLSINKNQFLILVLSALINPYLFLMVVGFNLIIPFKNYFYDKTLNLKQTIIFPVISIITVLILWYFVGLITLKNDKGLEVIDSYGLYGFNLNNFYNSCGYSKFLKQLPWTNHHQYEGFAYLGLGFIILSILLFIFYFIKIKSFRFNKKLIPLFLLVICYTLFSITNKISYGENIIEYPTLGIIKKVGNIFRASGRFIWIFYYTLYLFVLLLAIKFKVNNKIKISILTVLFAFQIYDISQLITFRDLPTGKYELVKFDKEWLNFPSNFKKIITYPTFQYDLLNTMDYQDLCFIALKNKIPITCGYVARESGEKNLLFTQHLNQDLADGTIEEESLYIVTKKNIEDFYPSIYKNNLQIKYLDGYYLLFKNNKKYNFKLNIKDKIKKDSIYSIINKTLNVQKIKSPNLETEKIKYFIEQINDSENLKLKGWAFLKDTKSNKEDSVFLFLKNNKNIYLSKTRNEIRPDITQSYKNGNLDNSGFRASIFKKNIETGIYLLGIAIKDKNSKFTYQLIEPSVQIKVKTTTKIEEKTHVDIKTKLAIGNIDLLEIQSKKVKIRGWSIVPKIKSESNIKILLVSNNYNYELETYPEIRKDITSSINDKVNYDKSGFNIEFDKERIKKGNYSIFVKIENVKNAFFDTKRTIKIE